MQESDKHVSITLLLVFRTLSDRLCPSFAWQALQNNGTTCVGQVEQAQKNTSGHNSSAAGVFLEHMGFNAITQLPEGNHGRMTTTNVRAQLKRTGGNAYVSDFKLPQGIPVSEYCIEHPGCKSV